MIARRVATIVVAVGLIVGAFLIRRNVIEGGDDDSDPGDQPEPASAMVCLTELSDVCAAIQQEQPDLAITVEDARATLDRLTAGEDGSLWLTFEPFPAMSGSLVAGQPLAASKLAVATRPTHTAALHAQCPDQPLWRCIGDIAGDDWSDGSGQVAPSVGDAGSSAAALASFAAAVAGYFGTPTFGAIELEDPSFLAWVGPLTEAMPTSGQTPAETMIARPSAVNIAGTSDAEITTLDAPGDRTDSSYPEPSMWLQAVLAAPAGVEIPRDLSADAAAALLATGWDHPAVAAQPLPSATTMVALRTLWEQVAQ
jgi:hypothetical protein